MADAPNWDDLEPIAGPAQQDNSAPKWEDLEPIAGPQQQAAAPKWEDLEPIGKEEPRPKEEPRRFDQAHEHPEGAEPPGDEPSTLSSAARGVARGVAPGAAGYLGGMAGLELGAEGGALLGGAVGSVVPGIGTAIGAGVGGFVGGAAGLFGGGALAAGAARKAQDTVADRLGLDSPESRERDVEAHPYVTTAAELGGAAATLSPGNLSTKLATRLASGGIMGAVDVVNQGVTKGFGDIDPAQTAIAAAGGAALAGPARPWARGVLGKAFPEKTFGPVQAEAKAAEPEVIQPAGNGVTWGEGLAGDPTIQAGLNRGNAPSPGVDVTEGPARVNINPPRDEFAANSNAPERNAEGVAPIQELSNIRPDSDVRLPDMGGAGDPSMMQRYGERTRLKIPERLQQWREKNPENYPPLPGVGEVAAPEAAAPSERPPAPPPQAPAGPDRIRVVNSLIRQAQDMGVQVPMEEINRRADRILAEQANQPAPRAPMPNVDVNEIPAALRRVPAREVSAEIPPAGAQKLPSGKPESENFGERGVGGQNKNVVSPAENAEIGALKEAPRPQSLSAAAPEGGAAGTYGEPPGAADLKWRGGFQGLRNALKSAMGKLGKTPQEIFSPETISDDSEAMDKVIRATFGPIASRDVADVQSIKESLANTQGHIQKLPAKVREEAIQNYERGTVPKSNPLSGWAENLRRIAQRQDTDLARVGGEAEYGNSLAAMFEKPEEARNYIKQFRDDNKRNPTIGEIMKKYQLHDEFRDADGSPNVMPIVNAQNFAKSRVITKNTIVDQGRNTQVGNHMILSEHQAPGYEAIDTRLTKGVPLYAPREVKLVLERYLNPFTRDPAVKDALDGAMYLKNATNAWNLAIDTYHMSFMAQEGVGADVARGFSRLLSNPQEGLKDIMKAPMAPYTLAKAGKRSVMDALQHPETVKDEFQRGVLKNLQDAGFVPGRVHGTEVTPELETGFMKNYTNAFKPAFEQYKHDLVQRGLKAGKALNKGELMGAVSHAALGSVEAFSRGLQLLMHPFFNTYIPLLKAGAAYKALAAYKLDNPGLGEEHYTEIAKRYIKTTDNAMGELNQSTLYWPPMLKFLGNLATVSLGWNVGNYRQAGSAINALVRSKGRAAFTNSPDFNPAIPSLAAGLVVAGLFNILYQTAKTGKPPDSLTDVVVGRTGGKTKSGQPERAILPGYEKDYLEAANIIGGPEPTSKGVLHMAYNKLASLPRSMLDLATNQNWAGKQIVNPNDPFLTRMQGYLAYVGKNVLEPIGFQNITRPEKNPNTNISTAEKAIGIRHAPQQWQEPQKYLSRVQKENAKAAKDAKKFHENTGY